MQGLHHQQQQLAALLSVALPKDDSSPPSDQDESSRLTALTSLHRAILYPPNALLVAHSSSFLSQGFSQLLADKSYAVRRLTVVAYGSLCSVVCSSVLASSGRQNHAIAGSVVDRFINWALPVLRDVSIGNGSAELALEGLREFLDNGDPNGIEPYVLPVIKACQELLEDERTSLNLLHQLLGLLSLISLKFFRSFQPHFLDIIDLLIGWALVPDLPESDRCIIMDTFLQFQKHWLSNLQFSLDLLSKFLGDMEVLLNDTSIGTPQQFRRLLALLSCFLTVLQVTASGLLEMNMLEQMSGMLVKMVPQLLSCLSLVGKKFGWSKWVRESWRCLTLLAEILGEKFSTFYPVAFDILFQSLKEKQLNSSSTHVHGVIKSNLQLLSLQKLGLSPSSVQKMLQLNSPLSWLRLHPNHHVAGALAATYVFLLQHKNSEVIGQAMVSVMEELESLKNLLGNVAEEEIALNLGNLAITDSDCDMKFGVADVFSEAELVALIKFDLSILLSCVSSDGNVQAVEVAEVTTSHYERAAKVTSFIFEKLSPFVCPILRCVNLQVHVMRTLKKLCEVEHSRKWTLTENSAELEALGDSGKVQRRINLIIYHLRKYSGYIIRGLHASSPLTVKLLALEWVQDFGRVILSWKEDFHLVSSFEESECDNIGSSLLFSVLDAASDTELKVRSLVALILDILLQAGLIYPGHFFAIGEVVLERLGDSETSIRNAFIRVFSIVLPVTIYVCGSCIDEVADCVIRIGDRPRPHWKHVFALKQLPRQLRAQQLVSILSYISQRWKVPLSSWIQRLVFSCPGTRDLISCPLEETENFSANGLLLDVKVDGKMLDNVCSTNNTAAAWWAIHEAARYCITVRLRTNLGGPTQTFAALERMLLDVAHVLKVEAELNEGNLNIGSSSAHLLPMRLLLDFVEALKKNVYNAYDGSFVLPSVTRQSSLFFRANKKVCEEWFHRICEPMMNAGLALQCHTATIHYCTLRLQDLRHIVGSALKEKSRMQSSEILHNLRNRLAGDVLRVLRHAAMAMSRNHEPEALVGLQKWASFAFPSLFEETHILSPHGGKIGSLSWITGLTYQAQGQYEKAGAHFLHLLQSEEALSCMDSDTVQFIISRIIESYTALADWKSLETWLIELQALRARHAGKSYSGALTTAGNEMNAIHALARFDEGDVQSAWSYLDLTPKSCNELTLDPRLALQRSEQMLLQAILLQRDGKFDKVLEEIGKAKLMLQEALSVVSLDGFAESAAYATQLHCIYSFEGSCNIKNQDEQKQLLAMLSSLHQVVQIQINECSQDCNLWMKVFRIYRTILPTSQVTLQLCQKLITLARKQKNFSMAHRLIGYYRDNLLVCYEGKDRGLLANNLQYETILVQYAEEKHENAMTNLWSFVGQSIVYPQVVKCDLENMLKAKACLKLAKWFKQDYPTKKLENVLFKVYSDFSKFTRHNAVSFSSGSIYPGELIHDLNPKAILDEIVGIATKCSSLVCPTLCKSWLSYASWCYSVAKGSLCSPDTVLRTCSLSSVLEPEVSPNRFQLTEEEVSKVEAIILKLFQRNTTVASEGHMIQSEAAQNLTQETSLKSLVQQVVYLVQVAAGAPGAESSDGKPPSAKLSSQLNMLFLTLSVDMEKDIIASSVNELIEIWWALRRRRIVLFGHAANGYLRFLSHSSYYPNKGGQGGHYHDILKQKTGNCTLRATLYVLHILLNYGVELKDALEPGLVSVPLVPWQEVTPQLFARLSSHSEVVVRRQLEGLLMMLAKLSPWSIVYPTLVGVNAYESEPPEELRRIMGCLTERYPKLIQDVQLLINELGVVTVLWEEQWLSTLQDLHSDVLRRIGMLKEEAARMAENTTLSRNEKSKINAAKYSAMMAPIIVALERRLVTTSRKPETAHEIWFQKEYGEQLKSAIAAFKIPPASLESLGEVWRPFALIAASLANHQRKSSVTLSEVAPRLALLSSSDVPVPGLETQISNSDSSGGAHVDLQGFITISSFCDQVTILSTKTKPKKLVIIGSNGQKYTYLLKGREDLRLDARIMQLLQAINSCLNSFHGTCSNSVSIRNYSVTPISGRAGLIQWVDNVTSIYSVFKAWQNRAQLLHLSAMGASVARNNTMPPVPRPSDMFYGKIIPVLKEKGIRRVISRGDWPHDVKRKVLLDLMNETPKQLLHQEIWCASEGFKAFSSKLKRFSGSVAAMSMVGHVLGLGDRHLDNILMDFCTGDVVHIDYNVCFDKGKRLKIPEIVPFRLTQTIEAALGLTGIEGTFRSNCEAVIEVLRKNKDILLMLLEVFVWDPLVEWTRDDSHDEAAIGGEERKGMELAVSLSLFASRIQEIRFPLQEHHDLLLATLPATESALEKFLVVLNQYEVVSALFFRADQERSNLLLNETSAKSILAEATSNSEKTRTAFEIQAREFAQAKAIAIEMTQESTLWMEKHGRVIDALRNGSVPEVQPFVALNSSGEALSLTSAVVVAGVPLTIVPEPTLAQCQDIDKEVSQFITELVTGLSCAITALQKYAMALQRVLPLNYITTSPVHGWVQALQLTVHNLSPDTLALGKRQAAELLTKFQGDVIDSFRKRHEDMSIRMENHVKKINEVEEECSELLNSIGSETESKSKDRLISAFSKFMQSSGYLRREEDCSKDLKVHGEIEEKKLKVITILHTAACALYNNVKGKILDISSDSNGKIISKPGDDGSHPYSGITYGELEEQIEKCSLVAGFVNEIQQLIGLDLSKLDTNLDHKNHPLGGNWTSVFQASVLSCRLLIVQITEIALPEIIRSVISYNSEVMDAFGSLSQIRGSIDTTLEQLVEVDLERLSILELEQNYFVKVGFITEQQLALEEAALKGRDHLSWEEAEELATQEEACREQLDQLHRSWNQKDARTSSLAKREASLQNALVSAERHFSSLTSLEHGRDIHILRSKGVLATLAKPFSELESVDQFLASFCSGASYSSGFSVSLSNLVTSGYSISESIWKYPSLLNNHSFFIWKVGLVDTILDSCIHDISSSVEHNLGFEQLYNVLKKKIEILLQEHVVQYLKERVAPAFLARLEMENEHLKILTGATKEIVSEQVKKDVGAGRKVQNMLEEYCVAHETARAAKSAVSLMKRQVAELTEALRKTCLEIVQLEWIHDNVLPHSQKIKAILPKYLGDENWALTILNLDRSKLLENIQSSMSSVARSLEYLQTCERTSATAEGQLERAMGWACGGPSIGGPSNSSAKSTGIPPQFHDHLVRRRQLLWAAREQSLDIMKICSSVLEFEASRDGILWLHGEKSSAGATDDGRFWQQAYLNALTRLDVTYHSFARAEQEWKVAQSSMEAAASGLLSATNELCIASAKAKSASGDMQSTLAAMQESANEASVALSAFVRVIKEHTALTSECGPMLEEVLAITEGLHDVHNLGKEAAAVHRALMDDLSKATMILQPLESTMSSDVAALSEAITRERESKMEISPIHGQALYQSYSGKLKEACNSLRNLVPSVTHAVKELHTMLTKLARSASVHAGNLHKALEGLGESQVVRSQEVALSRSELESESALFGNENEIFRSHTSEFHEFPGVDESTAQDEEWISPPDNICESSQESTITSTDSSDSSQFMLSSHQAAVQNIQHCAEKSPSIPLTETAIPEILYAEKSQSLLDERDNKAIVCSTGSSTGDHLQALSSSSEVTSKPQETSKRGNSLGESEAFTSSEIQKSADNHEDTLATDIATWVGRGKNAYALQVLRRIEMKIDGRDTNDGRQMDIAEQVDHLLKQATNIDNLCNMYEGWTPWI
ncbi:hypothetical protein H6P81_007970 [Aristolochia fimbriata]|uniref:non-specific serine/threonine protein kinase n=1 Tax=Aristolochia fimbriata TaxID=158543 RepID=A0AAV7F4K0_ARIFI|nr:hypothetical protein H6P81_007970 [Aristolochia fimbriata]